MLLASETWPPTKANLQHLQCKDIRAMIEQICSIKPEDVATVRSSELLAKLELEDLDLILRGGGGCREVQADMEETDRERLPSVEAHHS